MKKYIHGAEDEEQARLKKLNEITNQSFIDYVGAFENAHVLDIGCGMGNVLCQIAAENPDSSFLGIEISDQQYQKALNNAEGLENVDLINQDALSVDLPENHFDIIYCRYFLEHVFDPAQIVEKMYHALKPSGRIVLQENDLHNVLYFPEIPKHKEVKKAFCDLQIELGGNPYMGREIYSLVSPFQFKDIRFEIDPEVYTDRDPESFRRWMGNSMYILKGAQDDLIKRGMAQSDDFDEVISEMNKRIENPLGVCLFYWNRLTAIK